MTAALYDLARQSFLSQSPSIDMDSDNIKIVMVDTALYTVNLATHQFLSDIAAGARVATSPNLANKTVAAGVFDADDVTVSAVSGASIEALVFYKDTGVAGTSPLIAYVDNYTGLPFTPNGADVQIVFDNGANKIFKL